MRRPVVDLDAAAGAMRAFLAALGADAADAELRSTPRRAAEAYAALLSAGPAAPATFPNDEGYDELIVARDIPFRSVCRCHVLPFSGLAHVGYVPRERIAAVSEADRLVDRCARRLQTPEHLASHIANAVEASLRPAGVGVVVVCALACAGLDIGLGRDAGAAGTVASALRGVVRDDARTRQELLAAVDPR